MWNLPIWTVNLDCREEIALNRKRIKEWEEENAKKGKTAASAASGARPAASGASPAASGASPAASGARPAASGATPPDENNEKKEKTEKREAEREWADWEIDFLRSADEWEKKEEERIAKMMVDLDAEWEAKRQARVEAEREAKREADRKSWMTPEACDSWLEDRLR